MASEQQYVRRLGTWRAVVYVALAVASLLIMLLGVMLARAATETGSWVQVSLDRVVGLAAPAFSGTDTHGQKISLDQYRGKYVVLEWTNRECPYTKKQYDSGNMQELQKEWTGKGVVWLTMLSSAKGEQGYLDASQENAQIARVHAHPTAAVLDPNGTIGREYGAKTTPHMFIIDPQGKLIYAGAIDNKPTTDVADVKGAKNYVTDALTEAMAGQPVQVASTRPYGCSVKYAE